MEPYRDDGRDDDEVERRYLSPPPQDQPAPACRLCDSRTPWLHGCFALEHVMPATVDEMESRIDSLEDGRSYQTKREYRPSTPPPPPVKPVTSTVKSVMDE